MSNTEVLGLDAEDNQDRTLTLKSQENKESC